MNTLDKKLNELFGGKVVRKDLTKLVKGNAIVPTYVLEYLLGQYCATDDEETIIQGVESVKNILSQHFVHRDEAENVKFKIRDKRSHRIIDKVSAKLNDKPTKDVYEASFINLGLNKVEINSDIVKNNSKLLSSGVWCIVTMEYVPSEERDSSPWCISKLKPIQISDVSVDEYKETCRQFTRDEWVDLLMQSIGLNPEEFSFRSKLLQLSRLVPFAENNYNFIELGPKGTGKSHIYSEMSPHGILISGGEVSKAKLFVNNSSGDIGLVGYWDVVAYDEFAGKGKSVDKGLVDIMKNYMANKSFSRGTEVYGASASMVFVGNTDHSVSYMLKHSNLFEALPSQYYDTAFLDRLHCYIPGWEVQKLRNEVFTENYGFIVDYLAEILKQLRKEDHTQDYRRFFELSDSITTRDKDAISKSFSGLVKVIYPHGEFTEQQAQEILEFAIENRKRVKLQLIKMDETFEEVDFSFKSLSSGKTITIDTLEAIEYGDVEHHKDIPSVDEFTSSEPVLKEIKPKEGQVSIRDNQTGISYEKLFSAYVKGATSIKIVDPYIRMFHQFRNLLEFLKVVEENTPEGEEVKVHIVTNNNESYMAESQSYFDEIISSVAPMGIQLTYEFDDTIHDRCVELDNGWKIILGRGLDIFQKSTGRFDMAEIYPEKRSCKSCEITYLSVW